MRRFSNASGYYTNFLELKHKLTMGVVEELRAHDDSVVLGVGELVCVEGRVRSSQRRFPGRTSR